MYHKRNRMRFGSQRVVDACLFALQLDVFSFARRHGKMRLLHPAYPGTPVDDGLPASARVRWISLFQGSNGS